MLINVNVDNFDITIHVYWFWIVLTKCSTWADLSFWKIEGIEVLIQAGAYYLCICYIVPCLSMKEQQTSSIRKS